MVVGTKQKHTKEGLRTETAAQEPQPRCLLLPQSPGKQADDAWGHSEPSPLLSGQAPGWPSSSHGLCAKKKGRAARRASQERGGARREAVPTLPAALNRGENNRIGFYSARSSKQRCKQGVTRKWRAVAHRTVPHSACTETELAAGARTRTTPPVGAGTAASQASWRDGIFTDRFFIDFFFFF